MFFNATQATLAAGRTVSLARLVHFDFEDDPQRVWDGLGDIEIDGATWHGLADLGSIADAAMGRSDAAGAVAYELSGVSAVIVAMAKAQQDQVRGRDVTLYGRFIDGETLEPLDDSFMLRQDIMDLMSYSGTGPAGRRISLTAETIWTNRKAAAFAYFSDKDQEARFPGDRGLEYVALLKPGLRRPWPKF